MKNQNTNVVFAFSVFFLLIGLVLGSGSDTNINGNPCLLLDDNIIVLDNTSHKVKIDVNASTTYLFRINGSLYAFKLNTEGGKLDYTISKKQVKLILSIPLE